MKQELDNLTVSRNIKAQRIIRGLYQIEVAKMLGISKQTYIRIETKPYEMPIWKLCRVADVLGCKLDDFFVKH